MRNLEGVKDTTKLYNLLIDNILKQYPINNKYRVQQSRNYLLNLIINYRDRNSILESSAVRGVCAEVMFEVIMRYYKTIDPNILVMKNLLIPLDKGGTTQLDFVLLTPRGLVVVEVKSIFGGIEIKDGTMTARWKDSKSRKYERDFKPWSQNLLHIVALKQYLKVDKLFIENVVFIFGAGKVQSSKMRDGEHLMTYDNHMNLLKYLIRKDGATIPVNKMSYIVNTLTDTIPTDRESAKHITHLQQKYG